MKKFSEPAVRAGKSLLGGIFFLAGLCLAVFAVQGCGPDGTILDGQLTVCPLGTVNCCRVDEDCQSTSRGPWCLAARPGEGGVCGCADDADCGSELCSPDEYGFACGGGTSVDVTAQVSVDEVTAEGPVTVTGDVIIDDVVEVPVASPQPTPSGCSVTGCPPGMVCDPVSGSCYWPEQPTPPAPPAGCAVTYDGVAITVTGRSDVTNVVFGCLPRVDQGQWCDLYGQTASGGYAPVPSYPYDGVRNTASGWTVAYPSSCSDTANSSCYLHVEECVHSGGIEWLTPSMAAANPDPAVREACPGGCWLF